MQLSHEEIIGRQFTLFVEQLCRNTRANYMRKQKVLNSKEVLTLDAPDTAPISHEDAYFEAQEDSPAEWQDWSYAIKNASLQQAMVFLSYEEREIICLSFFRKMSNHTIASLTGKSYNAITRTKYRAINKLRKYMEGNAI